MKKVLLFMVFLVSVSFGCQKESGIVISDQEISIKLAQDQNFIDYFKGFEALALKIKDTDSKVLEKLRNTNNENERNELIALLNISEELGSITENVKKMKLKYGDKINEANMKNALKNNPGIINMREFHAKEKRLKGNLRVATLPCTTALDAQIVIIGVAYAGAVVGCTALTGGLGTAACVAGAQTTAIAALYLAEANWQSCMKDLYGHLE